MSQNFVYCVYCETTKESKVETFLQGLGYNVISALVERNIVKNKKLVKEFRSIIPGYVFFESASEPGWKEILKLEYVYYPLQYSDKSTRLKENDLHFIKWLKDMNGKVKISKAMEIGKKIKILEGPLKELEGKIVKINKRQKCAGIRIDGENINGIVWLSYELIV